MALAKKHLETLKNCYLVKPDAARSREFVSFLHGEAANVDNGDSSRGLPVIYIRKTHLNDFGTLLREVLVELKRNRITGASDLLAEAVIVLSIAYRQSKHAISIDQVVDDFSDLQATAFVGIPAMAVIMSDAENFIQGIAFGRFKVGGLALFEHHRIFGKSDDAPPGGPPNAGSWIMRDPTSCRVISSAFDARLDSDARERYLAYLINQLIMEFKADFELDQALPVALGAPHIDSDVLFGLPGLRMACVYGGLGKSSYTMVSGGVGRSFPDDLRLIEEKDVVAKSLVGKLPLGACPDIDRLLSTYSRFLLKAKSHETSGRPSDAFIHCIFSLDLLLGGKQDMTKNVTRRSAVIYSAVTGSSFKSVEKELRELFDARSKYVHEGKEVPEQKIEFLQVICRLVTECLLRARNSQFAESEKFVTEHWHPKLDFLVAAMNAGIDLDDDRFFSDCGVEVPRKSTSRRIH